MVNNPQQSQFVALAQKYGLSKVPQNTQELFAALQGILNPTQMELLNYLFQTPEQFQASSPFGSPDQPTISAGPTKDNAAAALTGSPAAAPAPGAPAPAEPAPKATAPKGDAAPVTTVAPANPFTNPKIKFFGSDKTGNIHLYQDPTGAFYTHDTRTGALAAAASGLAVDQNGVSTTVHPTDDPRVAKGTAGGQELYYDKTFQPGPIDVMANRKATGALGTPGGYNGEGAPTPKPIPPVKVA